MTDPDELAQLYIEVTDDLSYARTFYPKGSSTKYLNQLAQRSHQTIYKNKKEEGRRLSTFFTQEVPLEIYRSRRPMLASLIIFLLAASIGVFSAANDQTFVRLILGDAYVNATLENIAKGDPMAVYKKMDEGSMSIMITVNNIGVAFRAFVYGIAAAVGTVLVLFFNGIMVGAFQYFFFEQGVGWESVRTIWIHGTLEILAIVVSGGAGLVLGSSWLFPGTHSRLRSLLVGARRGLKIIIGLVPIFIAAGFIEGYVTRHTGMPLWLTIGIIGGSLAFMVWYFIIHPNRVHGAMMAKERNGSTPD